MFGGPDTSTLVVGNSQDPTAAVIWMHGLGDSPRGWSPFCAQLSKDLPHVKFVLPCAPVSPVTCNGGMPMTSWMDLSAIPIAPDTPDPGTGVRESVAIVSGLVDAEVEAGIPPERVVVAGFSQGGAMALATVLLSERRLGGCICLSGWALPSQDLESVVAQSANRNASFLVCHGEADGVVLPSCGAAAADILQAGGCPAVNVATYPGMGHSSCNEEEHDVLEFLSGVLH